MDEAGPLIAFDVAPLRGRPAGVGVYVARLSAALAEQMPGRLVLIGRRDSADIGGGTVATLPHTHFRHRHYHAWLQAEAERAAASLGAGLVHYTNAAAPLAARRPYVLTVHDLSVMAMPGAHPRARLVTIPVSLLAIRRARHIIVPSRATADELRRVLHIDPRRLTVVPHAPSGWPADHRAGADWPAELGAAEDPLVRHGLEERGYVLAVGTVEPRKNHRRLVEAFELLVDAGHDLRLVICGELAWGSRPLLRRIEASPHRARIVRTGYVAPVALARLVERSAAVCYVSLYEGYGLPVIEAMAAGAAVVTSDLSSMPEVAGEAAMLVDPLDPNDIAWGIEQAIARREELVAAGLARAAQRSWADAARETIEVYRRALDG